MMDQRLIEEEMFAAAVAVAVALQHNESSDRMRHRHVNHHSTRIWRRRSREIISHRPMRSTAEAL